MGAVCVLLLCQSTQDQHIVVGNTLGVSSPTHLCCSWKQLQAHMKRRPSPQMTAGKQQLPNSKNESWQRRQGRKQAVCCLILYFIRLCDSPVSRVGAERFTVFLQQFQVDAFMFSSCVLLKGSQGRSRCSTNSWLCHHNHTEGQSYKCQRCLWHVDFSCEDTGDYNHRSDRRI